MNTNDVPLICRTQIVKTGNKTVAREWKALLLPAEHGTGRGTSFAARMEAPGELALRASSANDGYGL